MNKLDVIIDFIEKSQLTRFRVNVNKGADKKWIIGGQFPDLLLLPLDPKNEAILFILKVETEDTLVANSSQWKAFSNFPSTFYIVVPRDKLDEAKKLAAALDVKAKFGWYEMIGETVKEVHYES